MRPIRLSIASEIWILMEVEVLLHGADVLLADEGEELILVELTSGAYVYWR